MSSVGSSGIRRRKPKRRLSPLSTEKLGWPTADETPPIMWSEPGSGFEANQYSPAGQMQREWWFLRRVGRTRIGRAVIVAAAAMLVASIVFQIIDIVRSAIGR